MGPDNAHGTGHRSVIRHDTGYTHSSTLLLTLVPSRLGLSGVGKEGVVLRGEREQNNQDEGSLGCRADSSGERRWHRHRTMMSWATASATTRRATERMWSRSATEALERVLVASVLLEDGGTMRRASMGRRSGSWPTPLFADVAVAQPTLRHVWRSKVSCAPPFNRPPVHSPTQGSVAILD